MPFEVLQVRSPTDAADRRYPVPADEPNSFQPEDGDGRLDSFAVRGVLATVHTGGRRLETVRAERIDALATITDSRIVFTCTDFRAARPWSGRVLERDLAATGGPAESASKDARNPLGSSLMGHVRYEWLLGVAAEARWRGRSRNALRLVFDDPTGASRQCTLWLFLPNRISSRNVGDRLVRGAAQARAAVADGSSVDRLRAFAEAPSSKRLDSGAGVFWMLPRVDPLGADRSSLTEWS